MHRAAWIDSHGRIPEGHVVRHRCDNPPCFNVEHLETGTYSDNLADMFERGRDRFAHGIANGMAKLTDEQVDQIRRLWPASGRTQISIADEFGITQSLVSQIAHGHRERGEGVDSIATRNARNRRAGARWQSDLRDGLREAGLDIERLALAGQQDEGDLVIRLSPTAYVVVEAKAGTLHPAQFVREADVEAAHFAAHRGIDQAQVRGVAVVKRRGANWRDAYVLTSLRSYFGLDT